MSFLSRAVRAELQLIVGKVEARMGAMENRLQSQVDALDNRLVLLGSRVDELAAQLADRTQQPQPSNISSKSDSEESQLDRMPTKLDDQTSGLETHVFSRQNNRIPQLDELRAQLSSLQYQLASLNSTAGRGQDRLERMINRVNNQSSQLETLTTRLDSLKSQLTALTDISISQHSRLNGIDAKLDNKTLQLKTLTSQMDILRSKLTVVTAVPTSEHSRLNGTISKTTSQQTDVDEVITRPNNVAEEIKKPRDCSQLLPGTSSGVYSVWPDQSLSPVQAFCQVDIDGGKMWTVFQRRGDIQPRQNFFLGWDDYKQGFGNLTGEFWWGLEYLSQLTSDQRRSYDLRIDLEAFDGAKRYASYGNFRISSEERGYVLRVSGYTGDAGNSLWFRGLWRFSTRDRNNDGLSDVSCAEQHQGAWWYSSCGFANLNGRYLEDGRVDATGIYWYKWRLDQSLKKTEMKIRPA